MTQSDDSDLASQLSSLRSEVFDYEDDKPSRSSAKKPSKRSHRKLSLDDMQSPAVHSRHMHSSNSRNISRHSYVHMPDRDASISRAVIETEQMGLRLTDEVQRLRAELKRSQEHHADLSSTLRRVNADNDILRRQCDDSSSIIEQLTELNHKLSLECDKLKNDMSVHSEKVSLVEEKNSVTTEKLQLVTGERDKLKEELETLRQKSLSQDSQLLALQNALDETKGELVTVRKQTDEGGESRQGLLALLQERDRDVKRLGGALREAGNTVEETAESLHQERRRCEALERELDSLRGEMSRNRQRKLKGDDDRASLERQVHALEEQRSFLQSEKTKLQDTVTDLKRRLAAQSEQITQLEESNANITTAHNSKIQSLRLQVNASANTLEKIQGQKFRQEEIIQELRLQLSVLEGKYATLKRLNRQLLTATNTYEDILRKRDNSMDSRSINMM
mmetsp:Transcript_16598/g.24982  ORF Transcript_16598/g.24982 Transcript_16598/m.24982 type:complete len:449 (+) Transcript_16598:32-1378(+)